MTSEGHITSAFTSLQDITPPWTLLIALALLVVRPFFIGTAGSISKGSAV